MSQNSACAQIAELIGAYVDDDLAQEARRRVEAHLMTCTSCSWEAQSLRITRDRLRDGIGEVTASDAFRARVLGRLLKDNPHVSPTLSEAEPATPEQYQLPIKV